MDFYKIDQSKIECFSSVDHPLLKIEDFYSNSSNNESLIGVAQKYLKTLIFKHFNFHPIIHGVIG